MKLHWSPRSPFVRKVMIAAHEMGLSGRFERVRSVAAATTPHVELMRDNPLSKIPTMVLDDGSPLFDSRVICEYLDTQHDRPKLFPINPAERFAALRRQALGDGMLDLLILWRGERERQHPSEVLISSWTVRKDASLAVLEREADAITGSPFSIGHVAVGCALGYLDFRFAMFPWREKHPKIAAWHATFNARPSVQANSVVDDS
jgi:glutathione S-transferase